MPIENISVKVNWATDKVFEQTLNKKPAEEVGVGVYNAHIDQTEPFHFKKSIRKVAVIGAGSAGVRSYISKAFIF
jgi:hypothetical protein